MSKSPKPIGSSYMNPNGVKYIKVANTGVWRYDWRTQGRVIIESKLKRPLKPTEKVIKLNGKKHDFELTNLRIVDKETNTTISFDNKGNHYVTNSFEWSLFAKRCKECKTTERPHAALSLCTTCYAKYVRQLADLQHQPNHPTISASHYRTV